ncbi:glycosyltransferase [Herbiconiux sp. P16]|uniref:glycosyltransferase n=1 Tax=Herbiconiux wuyangfengii TaxID=3342794 RepID=UPI0035B84B23
MPDGTDTAFDHFVVTRFSVRFTEEPHSHPEEWLRYRLAFFTELACVSLAQQAGNPRFRWLVFFDSVREPWFQEAIDELAAGLFEPVWIDRPFFSAVADEVMARTTAAHVITTRLDSDDAVARDFIAAVQAEFAPTDRLAINFDHGLQYERGGILRRYTHRSNAFLSLIERYDGASPLSTVFARPHGSIADFAPVRHVGGAPKWLVVVHGSNLLNSTSISLLPASERNLRAHFDVVVPLPPLSRLAQFGGILRTYASRGVKAARDPKQAMRVLKNRGVL